MRLYRWAGIGLGFAAMSCAGGSLPVGQADNSQAAILAETLSHLNQKAPAADLEQNIKVGDYRFVGVNGYSCQAVWCAAAISPPSDAPRAALS